MKIKLTRPNKEPEIISMKDVEYISAKSKDGLDWLYYKKSRNDPYTFEVLEEEKTHTVVFTDGDLRDKEQPTNQMSLSEHLAKIKELIG